jgi:ABC-type transport system involved in cytochrome bd biosynthesis fused ATPase/permease subunit
MAQYRIQFDKLGWRGRAGLVVAVALGLAAAIALVIVSLGVALILLPVVALAVVIGRWRLRQMMTEARMRSAQSERPEQQRVIDTEYTVIDGERR